MDIDALLKDGTTIQAAAVIFIIRTVLSLISQNQKKMRESIDANTEALNKLTRKVEVLDNQLSELPGIKQDVETLSARLAALYPISTKTQ